MYDLADNCYPKNVIQFKVKFDLKVYSRTVENFETEMKHSRGFVAWCESNKVGLIISAGLNGVV